MKKKEQVDTSSNIFLKINQLTWRKSFIQKFRNIFYYIDALILLTLPRRKTNKGTSKKKVLLIYNLALGDGIMFYGVSKSLREIWNADNYELSVACQSSLTDLFVASAVYDNVISLDYNGSVLNLKKRRNLFKSIRSEDYDIIVDPVGCEDCTTNVLVTRAALGNRKIGVLDLGLKKQQLSDKKRRKIYTDVVTFDIGRIHLIDFYAEFLRRIGAKKCVARLADLPHYQLDFEVPDKFFIIFPVASMDVKKWDLDNYAFVTSKIWKKYNIPLVICGTIHDQPTLKTYLDALDKDIPVIDYVGKTNIMQFTELIGRANLVITNDTSAFHIAVARQVKTFMLCGGYTYSRYANYQYEQLGCKKPYLITHKMECYDCHNQCKYSDFKVFPCIERITKESAWKQIENYLEDDE